MSEHDQTPEPPATPDDDVRVDRDGTSPTCSRCTARNPPTTRGRHFSLIGNRTPTRALQRCCSAPSGTPGAGQTDPYRVCAGCNT
jgi:hypothetical protein